MAPFSIQTGRAWPLGRFPGLADAPAIVHAVTTRDGPSFGRVGSSDLTARGSTALAAALGLDGAAWAHQVHGGTVLRTDTPGRAGEADGLVTATAGLLLVGRSADCPLVLATGRDADGRPAVGMAHASWRSTVAGITTRMIDRLVEDFGVDRATIRAAIAPSAGPCCYEVGPEVRAAALAGQGESADRWFLQDGERLHLDLWAANRDQLETDGVRADRIESSGVCTICAGDRFWSWRLLGREAGRFAGAIGLGAA